MWTCELSYRLEEYLNANYVDEKFAKLARSLGGSWYASGAGFGARDIAFDFPTKESAESFGRQAKKLAEDVEFSVWNSEE